jgi:hypothetical protein
MLTYVIIFILSCIIVLSFVFFKNKNKEFLETNKKKVDNNDYTPNFSSKDYELECRECCLRNRKKDDCVKNCFSRGFRCLCC